jgi:hypothetical protein
VRGGEEERKIEEREERERPAVIDAAGVSVPLSSLTPLPSLWYLCTHRKVLRQGSVPVPSTFPANS